MIKKLYALQPELWESYKAERKDLLRTIKSMSAEDLRIAKEDLRKSAVINDIESAERRNSGSLLQVSDGVAYIPIQGMLANEVDFCAMFFGLAVTTYPFIRSAIAEAEAREDVKAIAFMHDSGGGEVDGVDETAQAIQEATKPTFSFTSNLTASADYWLASQADHFVSTTRTGLFGSIGIVVSWVDTTEADKKAGVKEETLTSTEARKKRPDLSTDEGKAVIIKELDDIYGEFVNFVIEGRPNLTAKKIDATEGGILIAKDATTAGLIDGIIKESQVEMYIKTKLKTPASMRDKAASRSAENKTEVNMKLKELLDANPAAKIEHESALKKEHEAGVAKGKTLDNKTVSKIALVMESDVYSSDIVIRKAATRALKGEISVDVLDYAITAADAQAEAAKSEAAKSEGDKLPETPPGEIDKTVAENQAAEAGMKAAAGRA